MTSRIAIFLSLIFLSFPISAAAATLEVGPGKPWGRIEEANAKAKAGDVILVYPRRDGRPYEKTAVYVRQRDLTFRAVPGKGARWVTLSGKGFDHSGVGSTPRAIFQFNPGHGRLHVGGLRAHRRATTTATTPPECGSTGPTTSRSATARSITTNMGIMSNGDGSLATGPWTSGSSTARSTTTATRPSPATTTTSTWAARASRSASARSRSSLTGHNVKSRAHDTRVEYCYVHDSANREFDLVDAAETARPESHAVLLGNIIVKDPQCKGNRAVDPLRPGRRQGARRHAVPGLQHDRHALHLAGDRAVGREGEGPAAGQSGERRRQWQNNQVLAIARHGAALKDVKGSHNWLSGGFRARRRHGTRPGDEPVHAGRPLALCRPGQRRLPFGAAGF